MVGFLMFKPPNNIVPNLYILDCGARGGTFFYDCQSGFASELPNDDVINLNLPGIQAGDVIVIEDAHVRSRERLSLAQPFTYDQLLKFKANAESAGVVVKLFPQMSTPKARAFAGDVEKTDINDVQAIAFYLQQNPNILKTLKAFNPITLDEYRTNSAGAWQDKDGLSADINMARNYKYGDPKEGDYSDAVTRWIDDNIETIYKMLNEEQREFIGLCIKNAGRKNERYDFNRTRMYTLIATLIRANGGLRLRSDVGKLPFWKYVKEHYFGMSPYHMKGGVAASNVKYHWRRHASGFAKTKRSEIIEGGRYHEFTEARSSFDKSLRDLWNLMRGLVIQTTYA
jgi:hypothetical protein